MDKIEIHNLGPIREASLQFGDLTLLVGPQASGKSILLQAVKLAEDRKHVRKVLEQHNFTWSKDPNENLDRYFGEGMHRIWRDDTSIVYNGAPLKRSDLGIKTRERYNSAEEKLFYIPAQRILALENGWPRSFTSFDAVPYVLRQFSETLRMFLDQRSSENPFFPATGRLKAPVREALDESLFHGASIRIQKDMKKSLRMQIADVDLPFMAWSAGQKEFMPLLLSFEYLCPASRVSKRAELQYVILEEPEMGLHPKAIKAIILQTLDLISRGYKVIVSTHSPVWLEFAWAFQFLKRHQAKKKALLDLFGLVPSAPLNRLFEGMPEKLDLRAFFFKHEAKGVSVKDISGLSASSEDPDVAEWGGISSFGNQATDIVAQIAANVI